MVEASRLKAEDRITVYVDALTFDSNERRFVIRHLRRDAFGPDGEGNVAHTFRMRLLPGTYENIGLVTWVGGKFARDPGSECYDDTDPDSDISCVVLPLERAPESPQLDAEWKRSGRASRTLSVTLTATYTNDRPIALRINGFPARGRSRLLAAYQIDPNVIGGFDKTLAIEVPSPGSEVTSRRAHARRRESRWRAPRGCGSRIRFFVDITFGHAHLNRGVVRRKPAA